ncbi:MAG: hypothetical protein ACK46X_08825 [Candidatus Sericytochromatia bacterium]
MRISTLLTLGALGAAAYYAYKITDQATAKTPTRLNEPIVMWFETIDERTALCEGAD